MPSPLFVLRVTKVIIFNKLFLHSDLKSAEQVHYYNKP